MSSELLVSISGVAVSLLFSYFHALNKWYDPLPADKKKLIMLGALFVTAIGVFVTACLGWYDLVTCDKLGAFDLLRYFGLAAIANQTAYKLTVG